MLPCCCLARRSARRTCLPPRWSARQSGRGPTPSTPATASCRRTPIFAEACAAAGVVWVGPWPDAMRVMGHKARAKELIAEAGVPVLPSAVVAPASDERRLRAAATQVGYPLLVKASAGGGGRGMRLVRDDGALVEAVAAAQREAAAAFGSDDVFLERYLEAPRHVEVQVIGDILRHCPAPAGPGVLGAAQTPEGRGGGAGHPGAGRRPPAHVRGGCRRGARRRLRRGRHR